MTLIRLEDYHFVIVNDDEIKIDDIVLENYVDGSIGLEHIQTLNDIHPTLQKKVTHSSIPIVGISLVEKSEVKELIGEVDIEKRAELNGHPESSQFYSYKEGFVDGYREAIEDSKDRKYTKSDIRIAVRLATTSKYDHKLEFYSEEEILKLIEPKTQWEVEFVDGKLKLV